MTRRRTFAFLGIAALAIFGGACTSDDGQDAEPTSTAAATAVTDPAPSTEDCESVVAEAVDLVAQLVDHMDNEPVEEMQQARADGAVEEIADSVEQLHDVFGDTCAQREYEYLFRLEVAQLEANTEVGQLILDMFKRDNPLG